ncbi:MAG: class IV adenylate cyclase [Acidobacteriia bacterium]|nr:class IV adenylate cyclase [Terriglobia bacterium]
MKHGHEREIKLAVRDLKVLQRRLRELGFRTIRPRHFERNLLFDFADQRLRKARCLLRLRWEGRRCLLTFKGAPVRSRAYKIRPEMETAVANGRKLQASLECLGMRNTFYYEKYRTTLTPGGKKEGPEVVLDETPIGNYLELEGPAGWIDGTAKLLGYSRKDYITSSYAALYYAKRRAEGRRPENMVFSTVQKH